MPASEPPVPFLPGAILRALGALVDPEAPHEACRFVHLAPSEIPPKVAGEKPLPVTICEAIEGRVFVRATYTVSQIDCGVLMDPATAGRFVAGEFVEFELSEIVRPFRLGLPDDLAGEGRDDFPDLDPLVPKDDQRLLFAIPAKEMVRALRAMVACGCDSVEVLQPEYRGGPLGLRGWTEGARVDACVMPRNPFTARAQAADDVQGQLRLFDFRDVGDELVQREAKRAERVADGLVRAVSALAPEPGSGVTAVTLSAGGRSVTLTQEDGKRLRKLSKASKAE